MISLLSYDIASNDKGLSSHRQAARGHVTLYMAKIVALRCMEAIFS